MKKTFAEVLADGTVHQVWHDITVTETREIEEFDKETNKTIAKTVVVDIPFNPPLLEGSTLVEFPEGTQIDTGMRYVDGKLLDPLPPDISTICNQAKEKVKNYAEQIERELTKDYTPGEVASWPAKLEAAYAYVNGNVNDAQKTMIETEANKRVMTPEDFCNNIIIPKGIWYGKASSLIASLRSNTFHAIDISTTEEEIEMVLNTALEIARKDWVNLISEMP